MLKWLWKGVIALVVVLALVVGAGFGYRAWRQHQGEAFMRIAAPNGIGDALFVEIGGAPQWVTIRGQDHFALTERSAAFLRALRERVQPLG